MGYNKLKICPICRKAFDTTSRGKVGKRVTCSVECRHKMASIIEVEGEEKCDELVAETDRLYRQPRKNCIMYSPEFNDCTGLSGLWCTVEDCRFYKPNR